MAVAGDPFLAPRRNTDLILSAVRQQLFHHRGAGRQSVVAFEEAFRTWDGDGDHKLSHFEFEKALGRCGIFLPSQEVNALFRRFDTAGDGHADAEAVMLALRVPLNERRLAIVDAAFSSMSADFRHSAAGASDKNAGGGDDAVPLDFALDHWNPQGHPEVSAGRLTVDQMTEDFREFFSSRAAATAAPKGVTLDGFRGYYREVGVCEPYDSVFVRMIERIWDIEEPKAKATKGSEIGKLLRPKLLQHSRHNETPGEVFKRTLRYYSLASDCESAHGGKVDSSGLERALNNLGVYPEKWEMEDIFKAVGSEGVEPQELDKVVAYLCPPEPDMAPMF